MGQLILTVDDFEPQLYLRIRVLEAAGYDVIQARTGRAALDAVRERHPSLVVLDVGLPDIDGLEVCRLVKADPATSATLVLHVSAAFRDAASRVRALENGADGYLTEPVQAEELVAHVRSLLRLATAQAQLRHSSLLLRAISDSSTDVIFAKDLAGRMTFANPATLALIGKPLEEVLGSTDLEFLDDEEAARRVMENDRRVMETGAAEDIEESVPLPDGTERIWLSHKTPYRDVEGKVVGLLGISRDITDRRRAEEALAESEERYRALFENMTDGFAMGEAILDDGGTPCNFRFVAVNRAFELQTGLSREVLGRPIVEVLPQIEPYWIEAYCRVAMTGHPERFENYNVDTNRHYEVFCYSPARRQFAIIFRDITPRRQIEEELRRSEERYRTLFGAMDQGFCIIEVLFDGARAVDYRFIEINPAFEKQTGLANALGKRIRELAPFHEESWFEKFGRVVVTGEPARFQMRAGQLNRWFDVYAFPVGAPEERHVAVLFSDITERHEAQEALHEASQRKDEFIAVLSHELRNPLAAVRYALPLLARDPLGEGSARAVEIIGRQVDHLTRLVDDLLDVSRISSGKTELRREHVTLGAVVAAAVEAASPAITAARHVLTVDVPEHPIWLHVDGARISQVVTNLLNNSAKYTKHNGRIALEAAREDGHAIIKVRDNGVGIPADSLQKVFDMFHQLNEGQKSTGGLGIGLALARRLVEMHGGTISASSGGPGQGAEFVIRLPAVEEGVPPHKAEDAGDLPATARRRLKVLVVDDNVDLVEMLAVVIEGAGHETRTAFEGPAAIETALSYRPDVVLLDVGLPGLSGVDVARALRRQPETASSRLVALTGWGQPEDRRETQDAGFDYHLTKPTDPQTLERLLARLASEPPRE